MRKYKSVVLHNLRKEQPQTFYKALYDREHGTRDHSFGRSRPGCGSKDSGGRLKNGCLFRLAVRRSQWRVRIHAVVAQLTSSRLGAFQARGVDLL
jgi:hypothetical protein